MPGVREPTIYRIFDLLLGSDFHLPELPTGAGRKPDLRLQKLPPSLQGDTPAPWLHHWPDTEGETSLSLARVGKDFLLRCPQWADFRISADCSRIGVAAYPGTAAETVRHCLVDQVIPRVVAQRGRPVLHASAVEIGGAAVAFVGATGAGKSTLAGCFHRRGYRLLCDDALALEHERRNTNAVPSYPGLRLWGDSPSLRPLLPAGESPANPAVDKWRVRVSSGAPRDLPLALLLVLAPRNTAGSDTPRLTPLAGAEAVMALVRHSFQLDVGDQRGTASKLDILGRVVGEGPPIILLEYRQSPRALDHIVESVRDYAATARGTRTGT